ncbi:hypothetical protein NHG29_09080 [Aerococcaceae bacterium NML160702]|nr:hypothetical protein [Aerococcaceae bacterium NML160702]
MNNLFEFMGKISLKMDGLEKSLDDAVDKAEEATTGMMDKFKGAAKVIGGLFVADKIIDFGKASVEAAASAKAMQAQFEQVFDGMFDVAQEQMDGLAKNIGALPNRLKPSFNSIASFAKVAGMDTQQSLDFTTRAMQAAADTSAFMDKSLEETTETLKSYLKGNFAVADNLGILSTETTRNAAATELFGKKYQELSGIQQQEVLLKMYEDANKVSGAMGQAARESDGFENVMGNLNQAWQDFLAVVGAPLLEAVTPILQGVTGGVVAMSEAVKGIIEGYQNWSQEHPIVAQFLQAFVVLLATLAAGFGIYTAATTLATTVTTTFGAIMALVTSPITLTIAAIAALGAIIYTVWQNWETIGPMMAQFWEDTKATVSSIIDGFVSAVISFFSGLWDSIVQSCTDIYNSVSEWFAKIPVEIENIWNSVTSFLEGIDLFEIGTNIIQGLMDGITSMAQGVVDSVGGVVGGAIDWAKNLLGIHSPSRVFKEIGQFTGEGLVQGIDNQITDIEDASARMAEALHFDPATVDYTFKKDGSILHEQAPTQSERLLDEIIQVLRTLLDKDSVITLDGQKVAELLNPKIKQLNQQEEIRNNRMRGVRA